MTTHSPSGLDGRILRSRPGAAGLMTSFSWMAAGLQICSDDARPPQLLRNGRTMNRDRRYQKHVLAGVALGTLALGGPAAAADISPKNPVFKAPVTRIVYDWTGFYIGAHTGYGGGKSNAVLSDPAITTTGDRFGGI